MTGSRKQAAHDFESSLHRLEEIVQRLEQGNVPLEESMKIYEEGVHLSRLCLERLRDAELRLKKLTRSASGDLILSDDTEDLPNDRPAGRKESA